MGKFIKKILITFIAICMIILMFNVTNTYAKEYETEIEEIEKQNQEIKINKRTFLIESDKIVGNATINLSEYVSAQSELIYEIVESDSKYLKVDSDGIITINKRIKKGSYNIKIKITAKESDIYKEEKVVKVFKIKANTAQGKIIISLNGDENTIVLKGEKYIESGCHVTDKKEGDITSSVVRTGNVNTKKAGTYSIIYTATNSKGEQISRKRTVTVVSKMKKNTKGIPVIMYHYVYTKKDKPSNLNANYILDSKLDKQLKWLSSENYYYPSYKELAAYIAGKHSLPEKSVILTFDDGEIGFMEYGIPLLEKYKIPATSFVICNQDSAKSKIKNFASKYVTFQSHSYGMHTGGTVKKGHGGKIYSMNESEIYKDIRRSQKILGTTEAFAYPYGDVSDAAPNALKKAKVKCSFTTAHGKVHKGDNPYKLSRMRMIGDYDWTSIKSIVN